MHTRLKYSWNSMMQKTENSLDITIGKEGDSSFKASTFSPVFTSVAYEDTSGHLYLGLLIAFNYHHKCLILCLL